MYSMQHQQTDEQELITHSLAGDTQAYGLLVERYKQALYRHCFSILQDEDAAEDIAQEAFITAYYQLHRFDKQRRFSTWLFKIATNKALNYLKHESFSAPGNTTALYAALSSHPSPAQAAAHSELHDAVARLRPEFRAVVSLYYWQGMSYQEIATVLGKPEGSVKVWMQRAKATLQKELA